MTVIEIQHALAIEPEDIDLDKEGIPDRDLLVSVCAGVVMINGNSDTISLVHYTTQEYFERNGQRLLNHAGRDIAHTCLTYLQFDAFGIPMRDVGGHKNMLPLINDHSLLSYAAQHWGDHLRYVHETSIIDLAIELLEDNNRVHVIAWVKEYANNLIKRTYFRPRNEISGLSLASAFGLTTVASRLLKLGASIHHTDSNGQSALHRAVENGHADTGATLLDSGASLTPKISSVGRPFTKPRTMPTMGLYACFSIVGLTSISWMATMQHHFIVPRKGEPRE